MSQNCILCFYQLLPVQRIFSLVLEFVCLHIWKWGIGNALKDTKMINSGYPFSSDLFWGHILNRKNGASVHKELFRLLFLARNFWRLYCFPQTSPYIGISSVIPFLHHVFLVVSAAISLQISSSSFEQHSPPRFIWWVFIIFPLSFSIRSWMLLTMEETSHFPNVDPNIFLKNYLWREPNVFYRHV